ncbi:MAG: hypothetical protein HOO95_09495 [Gallionella sp.]|nr:hypothetical protein [Gallionella sp.]
MLKEKYPKSNLVKVSRLFGIVLLASLGFVSYRSAFSAEMSKSPANISPFRVAPIRLSIDTGGFVNYLMLRSTYANTSQINQTATLSIFSNLQARSYIWQPWFSTIQGGLGLTISNSHSNSSASSSSKSTGISTRGSASIKLIPKSRFPFEASINTNIARQRSGFSSSDTITQFTMITLSQRFAARDGRLRGGFSLTRDIAREQQFSPSTNDVFALEFAHVPFLPHTVTASATVQRRLQPRFNSRTVANDFKLNYSARPTQYTAINSLINASSNNSRQADKVSEGSAKQLSVLGNWSSSTNQALSLSASARAFTLSSTGAVKSTTILNGTNLNLNGRYVISQTVRATGSINVSDTNIAGQTIFTNVSLASNKGFSDITDMSGFVYKRFIGANLSNQNQINSSAPEQSRNALSLGATAGHSLTKQKALFDGRLVANINQTISKSISTQSTNKNPLPLLTHGSIGWNFSGIKTRTEATARLTASDTRDIGNDHTTPTTQIYGLLIKRTDTLPHFQTLNGSIDLQAVNRSASITMSGSSSVSSRAMINYTNGRPFNIRNSTFTSSFKMSRNQQFTTVSENTFGWDNNFIYILGALELKLRFNAEKFSGNTITTLQFNARRPF